MHCTNEKQGLHNILQTLIEEYDNNTKTVAKNKDALAMMHQFMTFFFAGMDTTGITASLCFYALTEHFECLQRVREEILRVVPDPEKF